MAVDEALSLTVSGGPPVVRFYGFSPPTLSVGRFQKTEGVLAFRKLEKDGVDFVRRPTGGQAVLHDNELTYSVILSREHIEPFQKRQVYRFVSRLFIAALKDMGIEASFSAGKVGDHRHPDCFATTGEYEIINASARKLIGSAQTTSRAACLQHGSIPLGKSRYRAADYLAAGPLGSGLPASTFPPSDLEQELGRRVSFEEAAELFRKAFAKTIPLEDSDLSSEEEALSRKLARTKYQDTTWNRLR